MAFEIAEWPGTFSARPVSVTALWTNQPLSSCVEESSGYSGRPYFEAVRAACLDATLFVCLRGHLCAACVKDSCSFCSSAGPPAHIPSSLSKRSILQGTVVDGPPLLPLIKPSQQRSTQSETSAAKASWLIFRSAAWNLEKCGPIWPDEAELAPNLFSSITTITSVYRYEERLLGWPDPEALAALASTSFPFLLFPLGTEDLRSREH